MTASVDLKANPRKNLGSSHARRDRKSGFIPAIICNKNGDNLYITVNSREFEREYFKGNIFTTIVNIELDGKTLQAISNKIDVDPVTDRPTHIDFIKFEKSDKVEAKVQLNFINKERSHGIKKGGFLHIVLRKIKLICDPESIPQSIDIDIRKMRVGDKIRATDVKLPENTKLSKNNSFTVASIIGRGTKETEEDIAIAEAAAEAASEEGGEAGKEGAKESSAEDKAKDTSENQQ